MGDSFDGWVYAIDENADDGVFFSPATIYTTVGGVWADLGPLDEPITYLGDVFEGGEMVFFPWHRIKILQQRD